MRIIPGHRYRTALLAALALLAAWTAAADPGTYQAPEAFVRQAFPQQAPDAKALWLRDDLRAAATDILGRPPMPRLRYWRDGNRTAWVLEEIGKDKPITAGVIVADGAIERVEVLVFRESRGWEVKYPFFTRQFRNARLSAGEDLDRNIDGITGATLSVRAMTRMARLALLLDAHVRGVGGALATAR